MAWMFADAASFNSDLSAWNMSKVIYMIGMFWEASAFNQNLCSWGELALNGLDATEMFMNSGCPVQDSPNAVDFSQGPWCWDCSWVDIFD
jgi:surface protein